MSIEIIEKNVKRFVEKKERQKIYQKRMSENILEKDIRKYIRKGLQKIYQTKIWEDMLARRPI